MDRRAFIAGVTVAAAAVPMAAQAAAPTAGAGEIVTMRGYLNRVADHYYVLGATPQKTDPRTRHYADWPAGSVRIYARDTDKMATGMVTVTGSLYRGKQQDAHTETVATVVMVDAVLT